MSVRCLRCSVDTLEVSLEGEVYEEIAHELDALKECAQSLELAQRFRDTRLFVEAKAFGLWRWRLTCQDYSIVLSPLSSKTSRRPCGQVRFSAFGLSTRENEELVAEGLGALSAFGDLYERNIARLDVCADLQGWMPTHDEMLGMSCAASYRAEHLAGRDVQTFQYGKGDVVLRIYDKSAEIAHGEKRWMAALFRSCEGFDPALPVTRIEAQLRTKALRELGIETAAKALQEAGSVLEWALRDYAQLRVPNGDKKVSRWPEHPVWTQLRDVVPASGQLERVRRRANMLQVEDAAKRLVGLVALASANYGEPDYISALQLLSDLAEVVMLKEHIDFADIVRQKRKRLEAMYGWDADVPF